MHVLLGQPLIILIYFALRICIALGDLSMSIPICICLYLFRFVFGWVCMLVTKDVWGYVNLVQMLITIIF